MSTGILLEAPEKPGKHGLVHKYVHELLESIFGKREPDFPSYCIMDDTYKPIVDKHKDPCAGCGDITCIGHKSYDGMRNKENQQMVNEWQEYIKGKG